MHIDVEHVPTHGDGLRHRAGVGGYQMVEGLVAKARDVGIEVETCCRLAGRNAVAQGVVEGEIGAGGGGVG